MSDRCFVCSMEDAIAHDIDPSRVLSATFAAGHLSASCDIPTTGMCKKHADEVNDISAGLVIITSALQALSDSSSSEPLP